MACVKLGSKPDSFKRQGQAWICSTGLPSDVTVEVGDMSFHLHKFPLLSKSALLEKLIEETSNSPNSSEDQCIIKLADLPGGAKSFELVARFCYGVKLELTASNTVQLRCAADHLQMTEEISEGNLISQTEMFLNQVILRNWKDSLKALQSCENLVPHAETLNIVKRCIDSLAVKACMDPNLFSWPMEYGGAMQSPGGTVLWNGISTGARPRNFRIDWWYDDVANLSFPLYKRLILAIEARGIRQEIIVGSLTYYAQKYLPGLNRRQGSVPTGAAGPLSEEEQKKLLEELNSLLPIQKGLVSTKILFGLLRTAMILKAGPTCVSNLETRIGLQLDQANLEDLLLPNFSHTMETLYNVECVQRMLEHFLKMDQIENDDDDVAIDDMAIGSSDMTPLTNVAKLIDGFLAEIAPDVNLKLDKFQTLASLVPDYARPLDDGIYRAIDIYLKGHPWLMEEEREKLCRLIDCQKLSLEACTHAAQNERLPLRVVVQVLFFEQLQLRTSIAGCLLVSDNLDGSRPLRSGVIPVSGEGPSWATAVRENQVLKVGMDNMRMRLNELEKECSNMRQEIEKLGSKGKGSGIIKKFSLNKMIKNNQMCSAQEGSVSEGTRSVSAKLEKLQARVNKHKKQLSIDL
ncbi:hypothetical protein LUZ60_005088 [Juncus effusus]|nr:hypothetical protein LUZ60_005088 [Juncus effusus]